MDRGMDVPPPKSVYSRIRPRPWTGDTLEPECEILEPGDEGYEEAGDPDRNLIDLPGME